jgi:hypothetical protein
MSQRDRHEKYASQRAGKARGKPVVRAWIGLAVLVLSLTACSPASQALTLTFGKDECTLTGTPRASAADFRFKWVIEDQEHTMFNAFLVQLDEGKSKEDLSAAAVGKYIYKVDLPWIKIINDDFATQAGPLSKDVTWDLTQSGIFQHGQAYIVCDYATSTVGVVGPITITE